MSISFWLLKNLIFEKDVDNPPTSWEVEWSVSSHGEEDFCFQGLESSIHKIFNERPFYCYTCYRHCAT